MIENHPHQRAWDVALFQAWRANLQLMDAVIAWCNATGQEQFTDVQPHLRRAPHLGLSWKCGVRMYVAKYLPLISDRLWNQPPERDIALIDKLQTSGYTTHRTGKTENELERDRVRRDDRNAQSRIRLNSTLISERNSSTDWNVTKSAKTRARAAR